MGIPGLLADWLTAGQIFPPSSSPGRVAFGLKKCPHEPHPHCRWPRNAKPVSVLPNPSPTHATTKAVFCPVRIANGARIRSPVGGHDPPAVTDPFGERLERERHVLGPGVDALGGFEKHAPTTNTTAAAGSAWYPVIFHGYTIYTIVDHINYLFIIHAIYTIVDYIYDKSESLILKSVCI